MKIEIIEFNNEAALNLSDELLDYLGVKIGDELTLVDAPGGFELRSTNAALHFQTIQV